MRYLVSFLVLKSAVMIVIVFLMSSDCNCSVVFPRNVMGWSAVCDSVFLIILIYFLRRFPVAVIFS